MGKHQMVKMWSRDPSHQVSWDGETFKTDKDGFVEVPGPAVAELVSHGLETLKGKAEREKSEKDARDKLIATQISKPDDKKLEAQVAALMQQMKSMTEEHDAALKKLDAVSAELVDLKSNKKK